MCGVGELEGLFVGFNGRLFKGCFRPLAIVRLTRVVGYLGEEFYVGHALSSYMFAHYADNPDASPLLEGGWKAIVDEGIDSTMKGAMVSPDTELMVLVDKKAFKAPLKNAITKHLTDRGVNWTFSVSDIKKLQKEGAGLHV